MNYDPTIRIDSFSGEYFFLSNFYQEVFYFRVSFFASAEHAYQATKASNRTEWSWVKAAKSPKQARDRGRQVDMRPDWEYIKLLVMEDILRAKFNSNPDLRKKLKNTGNALLIEGNNWHDRYWGATLPGFAGENHLGRLLMKIRWEL